MLRFCIFAISFFLLGCYTKHTSVISSYDLEPQARVNQQPDKVFKAFPHLLLNQDLIVRFRNTPARKTKPIEETCENSMDNTVDLFLYSNKPYVLNLDKSVVRANDKEYKIVQYKRYDENDFRNVNHIDTIKSVVMEKSVAKFSAAANSDLNSAYVDFNVNSLAATYTLKFDDTFSCGETNFEFGLVFRNDNGVDEKYNVYFFPWVISVTPH